MNDIINRIQELYNVVVAKDKELTAELQSTHTLAEQLKNGATLLKAKEDELIAREREVLKIEDVIAYSNETKKLANQVSVDRLKLAEEMKAFEIKRAKDMEIITEQLLNNNREAARLVEKEKSMEGDVKKRVTDILKNAKVNIVTG
jgi:hypothetical protein